MSDEDQLTDLLRTAVRVGGASAPLEPAALISRSRHSRRRQRMVGACALAALVLLAAAVAIPSLADRDDEAVDIAAGEGDGLFPPGWTRLPDAPLSPRNGATVASVGNEVVVVGGTNGYCQVLASCVPVVGRPRGVADGAAFDITTRTWRSIAPSPVPFANGLPPAVLNGELYQSVPCAESLTCKATLLRYRPEEDAWDVLPAPPAPVGPFLTASRTGMVMGAQSDERVYWRLNVASGTWSQLPKDPLPVSLLNARIIAVGGDLLLFGRDFRSGGPSQGPVVGARLDEATGIWIELPSAFGANERVWPLEGRALLNPSPVFTQGGGILDVAAGVWSPLPPPPPEADVRDAMVGALGATASYFEGVTGWVLDVTKGTWIRLPAIDDRPSDLAVTSVGRRLFATGARLVGDPQGQRATGAWIWTPPPAGPPPSRPQR